MSRLLDKEIFRELYSGFKMPLSAIDCGLKCGPYNDYGVPICCDIHQLIPSAFELEWNYLKENTDLWQPWSSSELLAQEIEDELQDGQVLLKCKGYQECQRDFRTLTCRAFPFYPYLNSKDNLDGLAYYPEFRYGCWIISNLDVVSQSYKEAFQHTFQRVFQIFPDYRKNFVDYCNYVRETAAEESDQIVLLGFSGDVHLIDPRTEKKYQVKYNELSAFGPFEVSRELRFPDD
jgi:hypothetical protein